MAAWRLTWRDLHFSVLPLAVPTNGGAHDADAIYQEEVMAGTFDNGRAALCNDF